ncbi:MAG: DUF3021 domain-containing protein [Candidatus Spyradocola sp.]
MKMKKKLIQQGLLGFPLGIAIGFVITILISFFAGDGVYYPVTPELMDAMGGELNAVMLQTALCGLMGSGFAMAAVIWDMDAWSLARQTGTYFAVACLLMLPIAYVANWMQHTVRGVLMYVGVFVGIFLIAWLIQLLVWKRRVRKINDRIRQNGSKS